MPPSSVPSPNNQGIAAELRRADVVARVMVTLYSTPPEQIFIADHTHEELSRGSASVAWEGSGMDCWPLHLCESDEGQEVARKHGLFLEPINNCTLGVYRAEN